MPDRSVRLQPDRADRDALTREGAHVMTVCNACRYCEQYCPVFPAMELRRTFSTADLAYLANLCHNCGECLYACQYAPPHEFGINVPRTLARIRLRSYEDYAWPRPLGAAFRRHDVLTGLLLAAVLSGIMLAIALATNADAVLAPGDGADFYAVVPHGVMVGLFGGVGLFVLAALSVGVSRMWRDIGAGESPVAGGRAPVASGANRGDSPVASGASGGPSPVAPGASRGPSPVAPGASRGPSPVASGFSRKIWLPLRDVLTLRHLHATGDDCVTAEETRTPWRRWFHHCTFYGFMLCFASTTVAAIYHTFFGWEAPYAYTSVPVALGTVGGVGLVVGPVGLWLQRRHRDPALGDTAQQGLDRSFLALLLLTSLTGLGLLALRHRPSMGVLLIVHLGAVMALFLTLPYGKFVHGFYRTVALLKAASEGPGETSA
jgi:citrate/tricarballylate utilization protein